MYEFELDRATDELRFSEFKRREAIAMLREICTVGEASRHGFDSTANLTNAAELAQRALAILAYDADAEPEPSDLATQEGGGNA